MFDYVMNANLKVATALQGAALAEGTVALPARVSVVSDEPRPGFIRQVSLGPEGLSVHRVDCGVLLPLGELLRLAEELEPRLKPKEV